MIIVKLSGSFIGTQLGSFGLRLLKLGAVLKLLKFLGLTGFAGFRVLRLPPNTYKRCLAS